MHEAPLDILRSEHLSDAPAANEIAAREVRFGDRPGSRYSRYRLTDPFMIFWFRHVRPLHSALLGAPPGRLWTDRIEPRLDDHMGPVFERIVAEAFLRGRFLDRIGPVEQVAPWWSRDGQAEIDLVVQAGQDSKASERWYVECKWRSDGYLDLDDLHRLRRHAERCPLGPARLALATAGQASPGLQSASAREGILLLGPGDLLGA